jgi:Ca2+-binding EF-hand superfamily protein
LIETIIFFRYLLGTDDESVLMNAFKTFDEEAKGFINRDK